MTVELHRCRFMDYTRPNVSALAFSVPSPGLSAATAPGLRLAVGRSNGDIEIWSPERLWHLEKTLYGARERSIEDLAWSTSDGARLFSVGASDSVTEWDLASGRPLQHTRADAGVIWAIKLSLDGKRLAAACETGTVVIFDVSGGRGSVEYVKRLQSADVALASLAWLNDNLVIAGSGDARVRAWEVSTGRLVSTMKVDKSKGADQTFVWAVQPLAGGEQFATGDSNGYIKIWDSRLLSLQQSFQAHPSDVLCLAADAAGTTLFSSGLDQKIVSMKITDAKRKRWTIMSSKVAQAHDVRAIAAYEARGASYLVSGGLERTIAINSVTQFDQRPSRKIPLTRYRPTVAVVPTVASAAGPPAGDVLLEWREQTARLWSLRDGRKRLLLKLAATDGDEYLTAAALSVEDELLAVASPTGVKLYRVLGLAQHAVAGVERLPGHDTLATLTGTAALAFGRKGSLVVISADGRVRLYNVAHSSVKELKKKDQDEEDEDVPPGGGVVPDVLVATSADDKLLAVARGLRRIELYNLATQTHVGALPALDEDITALAFHTSRTLVVATVGVDVFEFDTGLLALTPWSREHSGRLPLQLVKQPTPCCGIFDDALTNNRVWLWGPTWLAFLDLATTQPYRKSGKRRAGEDEPEDEDAAEATAPDAARTFWLTGKFKPIFFAGAVANGVLVSEMPPAQADEVKPFWSNRHITF